MKKTNILLMILAFTVVMSKAQTTAMDFNKKDCNGNNHSLMDDLDAGNAVLLHFFMPNCGSCPPPAKKIQAMANNIMKTYPGKIKAYAMPFDNSTTCSYASTWVSSNGLSLYTALDSGESQVAYYGGFGMPTVVLLGGTDHKILFSTQSFSTSDTTIMRNKILTLFGATNINDVENIVSNFSIFPNPAKDKVQLDMNITQTSNIKIELVSLLGETISTIFDGKMVQGIFKKEILTSGLNDGIYFIRINANEKYTSHKFTVIK